MPAQTFYFALQMQTLRGDFKPLAVSTNDAIVAAQLRSESKWWKEITRTEYKRLRAKREKIERAERIERYGIPNLARPSYKQKHP